MTSTAESQGLVLHIDDDPNMAELVRRWVTSAGYAIEVCTDGERALEGLSKLIPDAVVLDLGLPGMGGLVVLDRLKQLHPRLPVIILTADAGVDSVVSAVKGGAWDYLVKPIDRTKLVTTLRNAIDHGRMSVRLAELEREAVGSGYPGITGTSKQMKAVFRQLDRLTMSDITVLIHGESGTGKELIARAIHGGSGRKDGPFVAVNCASVPETLQESELFGHERGSFTGATSRRVGRFEQANGGTMFLDEIGELSLSAQAKLLRVLQERRFHRVGSDEEIASDFRLVAATHRDLARQVREGQFREDLYFRVAVFELELPPLRDRGDDVLQLAQVFVDRAAARSGLALQLSEDAIAAIRGYEWPGNVRELQNAIERAVVASGGPTIEAEHLPQRVLAELERATPDPPPTSDLPRVPPAAGVSFGPGRTLEEIERQAIEQSLARHGGNLKNVVAELAIGRTTLYRKLKQYRLG